MPSAAIRMLQKGVDRAKTFDDVRSIFSYFIPENEMESLPINLSLEDEKIKAKGEETFVKYAGGSDKGHYEIWELKDLIPSHIHAGGTKFQINTKYPKGVQERQYHSDESEGMKVVMHAGDLDESFLVNTNPDSVNGPPVISRTGVVLGGNSRTMSLAIAYKEGKKKIEQYKQSLRKNARTFGLCEGDIDIFSQPVLVRVIAKSLDDAEMAKMSRLYNQSLTQGMDALADGISRAKFLSRQSLGVFTSAMDEGGFGTIREFLGNSASRPFIESLLADGVIEETKINTYLEANRKDLTESGKSLVEATLRGLCISDYDVLANSSKSILQKIDKSIASLSYLHTIGGKWDLTKKLKGALELSSAYDLEKEDNPRLSAESFLRHTTGDMLVEITEGQQESQISVLNKLRKDPMVSKLFLLLQNSTQKHIREVFNTYVRIARQYPENQISFMQPPKPIEALENSIKEASKRVGEKKKDGSILESVGITRTDWRTGIRECKSIEELAARFFAFFEQKEQSDKTLYERLLEGEFDNQEPAPFLVTMYNAYKEVRRNIEKIKPPFKHWIELHEDWLL